MLIDRKSTIWLISAVGLMVIGLATYALVFSNQIDELHELSDSELPAVASGEAGQEAASAAAKGQLEASSSDQVMPSKPELTLDVQYFELARNPEISARDKYELSSLLTKCQPASVTSEEQFASYREQFPEDRETLQFFRGLLEECASIYELANTPVAIEELRHAWLKSAADDGLRLAEARLLLESGTGSNADVLAAVNQSVLDSYGDDDLRHEVLFVIRKFYRDRIAPENSSKLSTGEVLTDPDHAWLLLECKFDEGCDYPAVLTSMGDLFTSYEAEQIKSLSERYEVALENGRVEELGLDIL
jgi:hypothetical protein